MRNVKLVTGYCCSSSSSVMHPAYSHRQRAFLGVLIALHLASKNNFCQTWSCGKLKLTSVTAKLIGGPGPTLVEEKNLHSGLVQNWTGKSLQIKLCGPLWDFIWIDHSAQIFSQDGGLRLTVGEDTRGWKENSKPCSDTLLSVAEHYKDSYCYARCKFQLQTLHWFSCRFKKKKKKHLRYPYFICGKQNNDAVSYWAEDNL